MSTARERRKRKVEERKLRKLKAAAERDAQWHADMWSLLRPTYKAWIDWQQKRVDRIGEAVHTNLSKRDGSPR